MLTFLILLCPFYGLHGQTANFVTAWAFQNQSSTRNIDLAVDIDRNIIVSGHFHGTTDIDPGTGNANRTSIGSSDVFVGKISPTGQYIWGRSFGGTGAEAASVVATDAYGNIYIAGTFVSTTMDIDPGTGTTIVTNAGGSYDAFLVKLDSSGNFQWGCTLGSNGNEGIAGIACDPSGNVVLTGHFHNTLDFHPGAAVHNLYSMGGSDIFIWKLTSGGSFVSAVRIGANGGDLAYHVNHDNAGNIYVAGYFADTTDFDPGPGVADRISAGGLDAFVAKYTSNGDFVWVRSMGGVAGDDVARTVVIDNDHNVFVGGYFDHKADFDPGPDTFFYTSAGSSGNDDGWILKLDSSGNFCWAHHYGGSAAEVLHGMEWIQGGYLYLTGYMRSSVVDFNFDPNVTNSRTSYGQADAYVLKIDTAGRYQWAFNSGGGETDYAHGIATDGNGEIFITGEFEDVADFDPGGGTFNLTTGGTSGANGFVWHFSECVTNYAEDQVFTCDTYMWIDGNTYSSSIYGPTETLVNFKGCDSIVTLNLVISQPSLATYTVSVCDSFVWVKGRVFHSDTTGVMDTIVNSGGCDSVVTLNLDILQSDSIIHRVQACDSFVWVNGQTYYSNSAGTDFKVYTNAEGCDSTVFFDLTLNHTIHFTHSIHACDSFVWNNGKTYYAPTTGVEKDTLQSALGCDSVVTLSLSLDYSGQSIHHITACDSFVWINGVIYYTSNNTATHLLSTWKGCDSMVFLDLSLSNSLYRKEQVSYCKAFTWIDGNTYTNDTALVFYRFGNTSGCDSILELQLDITPMNLQIMQNGTTLNVPQTGSAYQWFTCNGMALSPIQGATQSSYSVTANGQYAVAVSDGVCSDTSTCHNVTGIGWKDAGPDADITIYPNPTSGKIHLQFTERSAGKLRVCDMLGKEVQSLDFNGNQFEFELQGSDALYWLYIETDKGLFRSLVGKTNR